MYNLPPKEELAKIPKLYETENIPVKEKLIYMHFFFMGNDWYIAEYDGKDLFFGFAILNDDLANAEWGYISLDELKKLNNWGMEVDKDDFWEVVPAMEVDKIRRAYLFKGVL